MSNSIYIETTTQNNEITINATDQPSNNVGLITESRISVWGTIFGNLSAQTDLWSALSAKDIQANFYVLSADHDSLKTLVRNSSASWEESGDVLPTVLNFLSSNNINLSSVDVKGNVLSAGKDLFELFIPSGSNTQTLSYNPSSYNLAISNGNSVSLSSINSAFVSNSAKYESAYSSVALVSGFWNRAYTNLIANSASYLNGGDLNSNIVFLNYRTEVANATATLLPTTIYQTASSAWQNTYTTVRANSAQWAVDSTTDTGVRALTGGWQSTSTAVQTNSSNWNTAYNVSTTYQNVSSSFATNTSVNNVSSLLTPLTVTNTLTSQLVLNTTFNNYQTSVAASTATLVKTTDFNSYKTNVASSTATLLPTTIYQTASGSFATNTALNSVSSLLTPLTLTNTLTSQLVTNTSFNNYQTSVANTTATLLPTTIYQTASGSFATNTTVNTISSLLTPRSLTNSLTGQLVTNTDFASYRTSVAASTATLLPTTTYQTASSTWQNTFTTVQANSAQWAVDSTLDAGVRSLTGDWQKTYTTVQANSSDWNAAYNIGTTYQVISGTFATNTILNSVSSQLTPLTTTNLLTSQLVLNSDFNNYLTSVAGATAVLLPTSVYQSASGNWENAYSNIVANSAAYLSGVDITFLQQSSATWDSVYTTVQSNSSSWTSNYQLLSSEEFNLNVDKYNTFLKVVTGSNTFSFSNFNVGKSITLYLSSDHVQTTRHYLPQTTFLNNAGDGNVFYSYKDYITEIKLQKIKDYYIGTANLIPSNTKQRIAPTGNAILVDDSQVMNFLLQEDDNYLLLDEIVLLGTLWNDGLIWNDNDIWYDQA